MTSMSSLYIANYRHISLRIETMPLTNHILPTKQSAVAAAQGPFYEQSIV